MKFVILGLLLMISSGYADSVDVCLQRAGTFLTQSNRDSAIFLYQTALRLDSNNVEALRNIGVIYALDRKYSQAIDILKKAAIQDSTNADTYSNLGLCYASLGDTNMALNNYRRAFKYGPDKATYVKNICSILLPARRFSEASAYLNQILKTDTVDAELYYLFGNVLINSGDLNGAEKNLERAVNLKTNSDKYLYMLGYVKHRNDKYKEAEELYRKSIAIKSEFYDVHQNLGLLLMTDRKYPEALTEFKEAVRLKPSSLEARIALGIAYAYNDMPDEAEATYYYLDSISPESAQKLKEMLNPETK
jgi:Flp pilus assembly protein TadD